MRKSTSLVMAAVMVCAISCAMASAVSCSNKNNMPENGISEPFPEIQENTEPVFTEYFPEDFREITVNFEYQDDEAPVPHFSKELTAHIEPEMSPCKEGHIVDEAIVIPESYYSDSISEEQREEMIQHHIDRAKLRIEEEKAALEKPFAAVSRWLTYGGGYVFTSVEYDDLCQYGSHAFDIIRINAETGEQSVVYSHRSRDEGYGVDRVKYVDGALYVKAYTFCPFDEEENGITGKYINHLWKIDPESGSIEVIDTSELDKMASTWWFDYDPEDRITLSCVTGSQEEDDYQYFTAEYDSATGEWRKLGEINGEGYGRVYGDTLLKSYNDDNSTLCLSADGYFTLHTGLRGAMTSTAAGNMISAVVTDALENMWYYVYDLEKKERYDYDLTGKGVYPYSSVSIGENAIFMAKNGGAFILLPSIGAAFREDAHTFYYGCGGRLIGFDMDGISEDDSDKPQDVKIDLYIIG